MAGELAAGGVAEGVRRIVDGQSADPATVLFSARNAERLALRLSHMRGAAMKLGQLLSLEGEDLLPKEFSDALAMLRASGHAMPIDQLRRLLGREYGKGWEQRFAEFEFEPIAAASIGQVHYAVTQDGRELALKIQYPGVAQSISSDVDNVAVLLRLLKVLPVEFDVSGLVTEAKSQLRQEADYLKEAENLDRYRQLIADEPEFFVPGLHEDFCTKRILAMDYVEGEPLERLGEPGVLQEQRDSAGLLIEKLMFRELFEFRFMQTDPNFANYLWDPYSGRIVLLDFGSTREFPMEFVRNYANIARSLIEEDRQGVRRAAIDIGYLRDNDPRRQIESVIDLMMLICEPLRHRGDYDFAASGLMLRARDRGLELAFRDRFLRAPPAETVFLHRKLVGSFLLCARIRARVDVQSLIVSFIGSSEQRG
jgi:predicted unusual protein kinase regulating ubiquinone biosynthesis (AarF/ABC1/UbiB family)